MGAEFEVKKQRLTPLEEAGAIAQFPLASPNPNYRIRLERQARAIASRQGYTDNTQKRLLARWLRREHS